MATPYQMSVKEDENSHTFEMSLKVWLPVGAIRPHRYEKLKKALEALMLSTVETSKAVHADFEDADVQFEKFVVPEEP